MEGTFWAEGRAWKRPRNAKTGGEVSGQEEFSTDRSMLRTRVGRQQQGWVMKDMLRTLNGILWLWASRSFRQGCGMVRLNLIAITLVVGCERLDYVQFRLLWLCQTLEITHQGDPSVSLLTLLKHLVVLKHIHAHGRIWGDWVECCHPQCIHSAHGALVTIYIVNIWLHSEACLFPLLKASFDKQKFLFLIWANLSNWSLIAVCTCLNIFAYPKIIKRWLSFGRESRKGLQSQYHWAGPSRLLRRGPDA